MVLNSPVVTVSPFGSYRSVLDADTNLSLLQYDMGINGSSALLEEEQHHFQTAVDKLIIFGVPAIIVIGFFGNTLSFIVFVCTHLRYQSCSVYLAFLNVVDIGFLLSLGVIWFEWLRMNLFHRQIMCQLIIYLSYVCAFLSSWTVVTFTIERYIVIFYPLKKHVLCTPRRAKLTILGITLLAFGLYSFSTWMNGIVQTHDGRRMCQPLRPYYKVLQGFTAVDTLITFLVPSLLIIGLNIGIIVKICNFVYRRRESGSFVEDGSAQSDRTRSTGQYHSNKVVGSGGSGSSIGGSGSGGRGVKISQGLTSGSGSGVNSQANVSVGHSSGSGNKRESGSDINTASNNATGGGAGGGGSSLDGCHIEIIQSSHANNNKLHPSRCTSLHHNNKRQTNFIFSSNCSQQPCMRQNYQIRTTRALVFVSSMYVLLNLPSYAFRTIACIIYLTDTNYKFPKDAPIWQNVLQLLYYINFASNVFLYSASSRSFRSALRRLLNRWRQNAQDAYSRACSKRLHLPLAHLNPKHRGAEADAWAMRMFRRRKEPDYL